MKTIVIYTDTQFTGPIKYTFGLMLSLLGVEYEIFPYSEATARKSSDYDLVISYGSNRIDLNADYQISKFQKRY